jgi:hypothetical protein
MMTLCGEKNEETIEMAGEVHMGSCPSRLPACHAAAFMVRRPPVRLRPFLASCALPISLSAACGGFGRNTRNSRHARRLLLQVRTALLAVAL